MRTSPVSRMPNTREITFLLDEVCTRLGLCLRPDERRSLEIAPPADAAAFAAAVMRAEGLGPRNDRRLLAQVRAVAERTYARDRRNDA
jgi:hypothetical protein